MVDQELAAGVSPLSIGYFSFTRKAANEARDRAVAKFPRLNPRTDFPYFRTLHSLAFHVLGTRTEDIMQAENYKEFALQAGIELSLAHDEEESFVRADNPILNEINLARIRGIDLREHYNRSRLDIEWHHFEFVERTYRHYKNAHHLLDFTDLLELAVIEADRLPMLETVIIDEAQDLSRLQWMLVEALAKRSKKVYLAGDDDQCQPGHSRILTTSGEVELKDLDPGLHRLICYDQRGSTAVGMRDGFAFKKAERPYFGRMYTVTTPSGLSSSYTENHHCIVRWKPLPEVQDLRVVYLMEKSGNYRIGQCQLFRADGCVHAWVRAHLEKADRMWFLKVVNSLDESTYLENLFSYRYGIPQTCFQANSHSSLPQKQLDRLFKEIPTQGSARQLLSDLGLPYEYPIYNRATVSQRRGGSQIFTVHAGALVPQAMRLGRLTPEKTLQWETFTLETQIRNCTVYSLEVERHHNYFSDGLLTHNCVFTWAGADVKSFLSFRGRITVLEQSYRVPARVHHLANDIVTRIQERQEKVWKPRDFDGAVFTYYRFEDVPVGEGQWLLMAATNYMLNPIHEWLKSMGVLFERNGIPSLSANIAHAVVDWERLRKGQTISGEAVRNIYKYMDSSAVARGHKTFKNGEATAQYDISTLQQHFGLISDAIWHEALAKIPDDKREYLIALLRRGTKLSETPRIRLSTIHGAKGGEADNVMLMMDLSPKFAMEYAANADNIHRLFYVGVTRAKKTLHLILPKHQEKGFRL